MRNEQRYACWRCTSTRHPVSECHAFNVRCRKCHFKGHLERACTPDLARGVVPKRRINGQERGPLPKMRKISVVSKQEAVQDNESVVSNQDSS